MKKSIIIGIIILLALVGFIVIQKGDNISIQKTQKNKVAATIFPLYDITRQIAGDEFEVELILPSGVSPHTFDPQPSLFKKIQGAQAIFAIGNGLDNWSNTIAESINTPIITMDENIDLRATVERHEDHDDEEHRRHDNDYHDEKSDYEHMDDHNKEHADEHHNDREDDDHAGHGHNHEDENSHDIHDDHDDEHHGHDHGPIDPHYWLSIHNAKQITMNIAHELSELDTENADTYITRAEAYIEELEALESELKEKTQSLSNKNIISFHDAWHYFAEEFGLNLVGTFEPSAGKEPTPGYIANLKEEVEEHNVSTLFMEPQLSKASITSFANDHDLGIATIDPLGGVEGRNSYIELMRYNIDQVVTDLTK